MRRILAFALAVTAFALGVTEVTGSGTRGPAQARGCPVRTVGSTYTEAVRKALLAERDVWGDKLLAAPGGPTYAAARRFLAPLLYGIQRKRLPLTPSGVYYFALSYPFTVNDPAVFALHVADGSEIITRRVGGPSVSIYVGGEGTERYGSCIARLTPAGLAAGFLPILETAYVDRNGVRYRQESFAGRIAGARSIVSLVRLTVDARRSTSGAVVRLVPSVQNLTPGPDRLVSDVGTRLIASAGSRFDGGALRFDVPAGTSAILYADWLIGPSPATSVRADRRTYDAARADVERFWRRRLATGASFSVPEPRVQNAMLGLLEQQIAHTWRYSIGNPYEELSFAEALDTAEVMAGYGYGDVAKAILRVSLERLPARFTSWRAGARLVAGAVYYQLFRDRAYVNEEAPGLKQALASLEDRQIQTGPLKGRLQPERLCSDIGDPVEGLASQVVAWQGLLAMSRVWTVTGHPILAARAKTVALQLETALRRAVRASLVHLDDGSVFVPAVLSSGPAEPYDRLCSSRSGSYWNLVMPYAFASGFFKAQSSDAAGLVLYLLQHGSRLLGVARADNHVVYGNAPGAGSGFGQVYGLAVSRFLADNDRPDQLVLSLYGLLAAAMTPDTFISGEAVSVTPVRGAYFRTMYMPPNSGANSTVLETLRLMLIHEDRDPHGKPVGLDLAFATPRDWLARGKTIRVEAAPTSFGRVSFSIERRGQIVLIRVAAPPAPKLRLRLRLPAGEQVAGVRLGSRRIRIDTRTGTIDLTGLRGPLELRAQLVRRISAGSSDSRARSSPTSSRTRMSK